MGFFDRLQSNPGGSGVFGATGPSTYGTGDALQFKRQRDLYDMENEQKMANFNSDLSLKQGRLRQLYADPNHGGPAPNAGLPNVVFKDNNPDITPLQGAELDIQKKRFTDERSDKAFGQDQARQRTDIAKGDLELEKKKNQQIFDTKQADLERKANEAANREQLAREQMKGRENDAAVLAKHRDAQLAAQQANHELELHRRDAASEEQKRQFQERMDAMQRKIDQGSNTETDTEVSPEGNKKTTKVTRGNKNPANDPLGIR